MMDSFHETATYTFNRTVNMWETFSTVLDRVDKALTQFPGSGGRGHVFLQSSDGSSKVRRPTLEEAKEVLDSNDLTANYSFATVTKDVLSPVVLTTVITVFVWVDQAKIMVDGSGSQKPQVNAALDAARRYLTKIETESAVEGLPTVVETLIASAEPPALSNNAASALPQKKPFFVVGLWRKSKVGTIVVGLAAALATGFLLPVAVNVVSGLIQDAWGY